MYFPDGKVGSASSASLRLAGFSFLVPVGRPKNSKIVCVLKICNDERQQDWPPPIFSPDFRLFSVPDLGPSSRLFVSGRPESRLFYSRRFWRTLEALFAKSVFPTFLLYMAMYKARPAPVRSLREYAPSGASGRDHGRGGVC